MHLSNGTHTHSPLVIVSKGIQPAILVLLHDLFVKVAHCNGLTKEVSCNATTVHGMVNALPSQWVYHTSCISDHQNMVAIGYRFPAHSQSPRLHSLHVCILPNRLADTRVLLQQTVVPVAEVIRGDFGIKG